MAVDSCELFVRLAWQKVFDRVVKVGFCIFNHDIDILLIRQIKL